MIEHLYVSRAAYFYGRKRRLSNAAIDRLFRMLRSNAVAPSKNLFSAHRVELEHSTYSAICLSFERSPAFLTSEARAVERVFGFLMIVERGNLIAVLKAGLDLPSTFKSYYLDKIESDRVDRAIARHGAVFEKLRLKNMSTSKHALRSKTLEARNLENTVPTSGASHFVPRGYNVRRDDGNYSATPNTGRISIQADRAGFEEIVRWAGEVMDLLAAGAGETAAFIRNFARPMDLASIPDGVKPTYLAVDVPGLDDLLSGEEGRKIRLVLEDRGAFVEMNEAAIGPLREDLDRTFAVVAEQGENHVEDPDSGVRIGMVKVRKTRIALADFALQSIEEIFVEDAALPLGTDADRRPLARFLDQENLFTVLFSDLSLAYIDGSLYRDEALRGGGVDFLRHLLAVPRLAQATSEKGAFVDGQQVFGDLSVFRAVVDQIAQEEDVLLCDDLGDEWADFIGVRTTTRPAMVSFYHAKHGRRSLGASAFHEAVGQAQKNLGRMMLPPEAMPPKYASWETNYRADGAETAIPRIMRGGSRAEIERRIEEARSAPDLVKRVFIVTSSLSRLEVEAAFAGVTAGQAPAAHFIQLYWLLTSFFSACTEVGAIGYVVCQP
jgi:hypothetical protein